jgi:TPR repeat protein
LANHGSADAQTMLGVMYERGRGVPENYVKAQMWYELAASSALLIRGIEVAHRNALAAKMTPDQVAEAQALAHQWRPTK